MESSLPKKNVKLVSTPYRHLHPGAGKIKANRAIPVKFEEQARGYPSPASAMAARQKLWTCKLK